MNWPIAWRATSSCRATKPGTRPVRRGTWPSTSGRSPSSTRSRRTMSWRPSASRRSRGLRIAFNAGGHNAGPIDWSRDTLLLKTERMDGIEIDVEGRRARVGAGRAVAATRGRRRGPRSGLSRRHVTERRGARLRARGRPQLDDPHVRPRLQQHRLGGRGDGRRAARPGRPRDRARAVLGAPWWRRERRRRHARSSSSCSRSPRSMPGRCSGRSSGRRRSSRPGGTGSKPCPTPANRSDACSSCRTSRSCPRRFAAGRSSWSRRRSSATRAMAPRCCSRSVTLGRRWTPSR